MHSLSQYGSIFCCTLAPSIRCLYLVLSTVEYWKLHTVTLLPWAGNGTDFWWEQYTISVYSNSIHTRDTINLCLMHLWDCYSVRTTFTSGQEEGHGARSGDVNGPIQDDNKWRFNHQSLINVCLSVLWLDYSFYFSLAATGDIRAVCPIHLKDHTPLDFFIALFSCEYSSACVWVLFRNS